MKILLLGEYSGLNNELKNALVNNGHDVTLAAANDFFKAYPTDINLGYGKNIYIYKLRQLFLPFFKYQQLKAYDVVHIVNFYIFPRFAFLNLMLIRFLKANNIVVTLAGAGDDPFFVKYSESTMRYNPIKSHEKYDRSGKLYYMRKSLHLKLMHRYMKYVDFVIPIMYEYYSTFLAAGYTDKVHKPIPIPINCENIKFTPPSAKVSKIIFFHGLNRPGFKGTFFIASAFEKLSIKYPENVECIIRGNMPFDDYMELMSKMAVSIDQVFSYSLGMNALYSMAQGKVVCGGAEIESSILYDGDLPPVYNLCPDSEQILETLESIVKNKEELHERAVLSRNFIIKHHNPSTVANKYISLWSSLL